LKKELEDNDLTPF